MKVEIIPAVGGGSPESIAIAENEDIQTLKSRYRAVKDLQESQHLVLIYKKHITEDKQTMQELGIKNGDQLKVTVPTRGG